MELVMIIAIFVFMINLFVIMNKSELAKVKKSIPLISNVCSTIACITLFVFAATQNDKNILALSIVFLIINLVFYVVIVWEKIIMRCKVKHS